MPDTFAYLGEVLEQYEVAHPPFHPAIYGWRFSQAVPAGASVIMFARAWSPDALHVGAGIVQAPEGYPPILSNVFLEDAIHTAMFNTAVLGFDFPSIWRLYVIEDIPEHSFLVSPYVEVMGGHAFMGLKPNFPPSQYFDGTGLAHSDRENVFAQHTPFLHATTIPQFGQATCQKNPALPDGATTTLSFETNELRHWRLISDPDNPGHLLDDSAPLTSGSWVFIGQTFASFSSRTAPVHFPSFNPAEGWTALAPRYSREADDLKSPEPPAAFPGPISFPFFQKVTGATPRTFAGSLTANWRSGTVVVAYKLGHTNTRLWPFNLYIASTGFYFRTDASLSGNIWVRCARNWSRPFDSQIQVTALDAGDVRPVLFWEAARERLWVLWERTDVGVFQCYSDDDGRTFSAETLLMAEARVPFAAAEDSSGNELRAAYLAGTIQGIFRPAGEAARAPIAFQDDAGSPLAVEEDTFSFVYEGDDQARLILTVHILGETDPSDWLCTDGGEYLRFQRITP